MERKHSHGSRVYGLDLDPRLEHHLFTWKLKRIIWILMALLVITALAGAFGPGPLSKQNLRSSAFRLTYDRFVREKAPTELQFEVSPLTDSDEINLSLSKDYLRRMEIREIQPRPERVIAQGDDYQFEFKCTKSSEASLILFRMEPQRFGKAAAVAKLGNIHKLEFKQVIYP